MTIGNNIKRIRKEMNMTQKELGEKLGGISQQQIAQWENGRSTPKLATIRKISDALQVPLYEFLHEVQGFWDTVSQSEKEEDLSREHRGPWSYADAEEYFSYSEHEIEKNLMNKYRSLTPEGREKVLEYAVDMTKIPEYQKKKPEK